MELEALKQNSSKILPLMYHDIYIADKEESGFNSVGAKFYKIEQTVFRQHVQLLSDYCDNYGLSKSVVDFSFDDGGESAYLVAAPILEEYGFHGSFFVVMEKIGEKGFLDKDQLIDLQKKGHQIGSHTFSHPKDLTSLDYEHWHVEWEKSIKLLNKILPSPVRIASVPNGFYSTRDVSLMQNLGIERLYTSKLFEYKFVSGVEIVGRMPIDSSTSLAKFKRMLFDKKELLKLKNRQRIIDLIKGILGSNNYYIVKKKIRRLFA